MYILTSSDNNYVQHLGVMLVSLLENCPQSKPGEIAIIDDGINPEGVFKLKKTLLKYDVPLRFIKFDNKVFAHLKPKNNKTLAAFHRIFLSEFYPEEVEKVLYLDCDIIIRKDISALYNTNISDYVVGAVQNDGLYYQERLGIPGDYLFFNSGVLLINMQTWKEKKIQEKLVHYINNHFDTMLRNDQDALNAILYDSWLSLNPTWNAHLYFFTSPHMCRYEQVNLQRIIADPAVVHFTTQNKPWLYKGNHPFNKDYFKYLQITEWKNYIPPDRTFRNILRKKWTVFFEFIYWNYKRVRRSIKKLLLRRNGKSGA